MASEVSIQIRIDAAIQQLEQIARANGIQDEIPRNARGGEGMLRAVQLETVVAWFEQLLGGKVIKASLAEVAQAATDKVNAELKAVEVEQLAKKKK